jgi:hypothetical protein
MCTRGRDDRAVRFALAVVLSLLLAPVAACERGDSGSPGAAGTPTPAETSAARPATPAPTPAAAGPALTREAVMGLLDGRRITVGDRVVRLDRATLVCGGIGRPSDRQGGRPAWARFRCVQPTFPPGAVAGPDAILVVEAAGRRRIVVIESRLTGY